MPYKDPVRHKAAQRRWYLENLEKQVQYSQNYREAHKEETRAKKLAWYHANKKHANDLHKAWRAQKKHLKAVAEKAVARAKERAQMAIRGYSGDLKPNGF